MANDKVAHSTGRNAGASTGGGHGGSDQAPVADPSAISAANWLGLVALLVSLLMVVLGLTPFTHNLDDIKVLIFFTTGPLLMLLSMWLILSGRARPPHMLVIAGLGAYYVILLLSVALSDYSWVGIHQIFFVWSAAGYFLLAHCVASHERGGNLMLRALVLLLFITNCLGMFMFDFRSHPDHKSGVAFLFNFMYGNPPRNPGTPFFDLLYTLKFADRSMQSTILNRDFYAAFCVLYLPLAILLSVDPGRSRRPMLWRAIGLIAVTFSIICIFQCKSKAEWFFGAFVFVAMMSGVFMVGNLQRDLKRHVIACIIGLGVLVMVMGFLYSPTLLSSLKSVSFSVSSRSIIWAGSTKIFEEYPILGGGPGTFRIFFPQFRAPNYFDHEISHVTLYSHNYFFDLLAETGLLGFLAYMLFLGTIWLGCANYSLRHPNSRMRLLCLGAALALVGMYGSNFTSPNARWVIGGSSLWTVLGFASGLLTRASFSRRQEDPNAPTAMGWSGNTKLLYVAICIGAIMLLMSFREGSSYWVGSRAYADGLRKMDPVYNAMQRGTQPNAKMTQLLEESLTEFNRAIDAYPYHISSYYKMGSVYTNLYSVYDNLANEAKDPKEKENRRYQANLYLTRAKESYEKLAKDLYPDYAEVHFNMGVIYPMYANYLRLKSVTESNPEARKQMLDEAKQYDEDGASHLRRMFELSDREEVALRAGMEFVKMGREAEALEIFREAAQTHPSSLEVNRYYYQVAANQENSEDMVAAIRNIWHIYPENDDYLNALLTISFTNKYFDVAAQVADELEAINPIDPRIQEVRIMVAIEDKQYAQALELWKKYKMIEVKDPKICSKLIGAAAEIGDQAAIDDIRNETGLTTGSL